jgi:hypothetical protein
MNFRRVIRGKLITTFKTLAGKQRVSVQKFQLFLSCPVLAWL